MNSNDELIERVLSGQASEAATASAIRELQAERDALQQQVEALKAENERLREWNRLQVEIINEYEATLTGKEAG